MLALCAFGFPGVQTAKSTKIAALYRPHAVTMLDSHLSLIFGFGPHGFAPGQSKKSDLRRRDHIAAALHGLAETLRLHTDWIAGLRDAVADLPGTTDTSDVRLLDIALWATWDDLRPTRRVERTRIRWTERTIGDPIPLESLCTVPIL